MTDKFFDELPNGLFYNKLRRLGFVDLDTGEQVDQGLPVLQRTKIGYFKEDYAVIFQNKITDLAMMEGVSGNCLKVWLLLIGQMKMKNFVRMTHKEIAEALRISPQMSARHVSTLVKIGYLARGGRPGVDHYYTLPAEAVWKGPSRERQRHLTSV